MNTKLNPDIWGERIKRFKKYEAEGKTGRRMGPLGLITDAQKADIYRMATKLQMNATQIQEATHVSHKKVQQILCVGGQSSDLEYTAWIGMRNRCRNPNAAEYDRYGGRGIGVCKRWAHYKTFLADMGRKPTPKHTLERLDNDKGYSPHNCVWATRQDQAQNREICTITPIKARAVRDLHSAGRYTHRDIATLLSVPSVASVSQIIRGEIWKNATRCTY